MIDQKTAPYAALILRVTMGVMFLAHAYLKVFVFGMAGAGKFFASIGLPSTLTVSPSPTSRPSSPASSAAKETSGSPV